MSRVLIISNRLPVSITKQETGGYQFSQSVGGLSTGLSSINENYETHWIGSIGLIPERESEKQIIIERLKSERMSPVFLPTSLYELFYDGFCNGILWPLFHYFQYSTESNDQDWAAYVKVNEIFADEICKILKENDRIWIHDYHFFLLPELIRKRFQKVGIGFFLHIPFPASDVFRALKWRKNLLNGLLGADFIGFHTFDYVRNFMNSVGQILGYEIEGTQIIQGIRSIEVDALPMGIDYEKFVGFKTTDSFLGQVSALKQQFHGKRVILSADRLDYTKGILQRLNAFDNFLSLFPEYLQKVVLVLVVSPSRTHVKQYHNLKVQIDELVGKINGKYQTINWNPITYIYRALSLEDISVMYALSDVGLVTPFRDGMNLIAKEFIAIGYDKPAVLILSEMAGAASELNEAVIINPYDVHAMTLAIKEALEMPKEQLFRRNNIMKAVIEKYDINNWTRNCMQQLEEAHKKNQKIRRKLIEGAAEQKILADFEIAQRRLILLDYDGTLEEFQTNPDLVVPSDRLLTILETMASDIRNDIVIVSGRDKNFLENHLGHLNIDFVAGHGTSYKTEDLGWISNTTQKQEWFEEIEHIFERFVERTPNSFIENKEYSMTWHYRQSDEQLIQIRLPELKNELNLLREYFPIKILEGNKVIEVMGLDVNKGKAINFWLNQTKYDFIVAIGDDTTDEYMFRKLVSFDSYTIKVGVRSTAAKYFITNVDAVLNLLSKLAFITQKTKTEIEKIGV